MTQSEEGDTFYRMNGAGAMLVFSAVDFEDFMEYTMAMAAGTGGAFLRDTNLEWDVDYASAWLTYKL